METPPAPAWHLLPASSIHRPAVRKVFNSGRCGDRPRNWNLRHFVTSPDLDLGLERARPRVWLLGQLQMTPTRAHQANPADKDEDQSERGPLDPVG